MEAAIPYVRSLEGMRYEDVVFSRVAPKITSWNALQ
jgi:hypothetical protein